MDGVNGWTDVWVDEWMWMDVWVNGWMDVWMRWGGWDDGEMNGQSCMDR